MMATANDLESRLSAERNAVNVRIDDLRAEAARTHEDRQARNKKFATVAVELASKVGRPRLESLLKQFPDVKEKGMEVAPGRGAKLNFNSDLARVTMELAIHPVENSDELVVSYDLSILPVFIEFERHAELRQPLDAVDSEAVGRWIDDRLVAFAKTYYSMQFTEQYQQRHQAVDPVAGMRFPISFAVGTVQHKGATYHFLSEQTKAEFERNPNAYSGAKAAGKP
jgi:YHS domain-containing protein